MGLRVERRAHHRRRRAGLALALLAPLAAQDRPAAATELGPGFQEDVLVYGLRYPVAAEYAPDGRLFILEKGGTVWIAKQGRLRRRPFLRLKVDDLSERGLLGLAFDPSFATNSYVYFYRTTPGANPKNRVERYRARGDRADPDSRELLFAGIRSDAGFHNAGCLRFGPDGKLYVATGDGGRDAALAQDLSSPNGKILRLEPDGTAPADNPFVNRPGALPHIWCLGLRNPWRFAFHPDSGRLAIGDVGSNRFEEINLGRGGANFGWPLAEGPAGDPDLVDPIYSYGHQQATHDAAVTLGLFYTGRQYPAAYRDQLFFSDYVRGFVRVLQLDAQDRVTGVEEFATGLITPVHMFQTPEGAIGYVSIHDGELRRIAYVGGRNRPPVVVASASKQAGAIPLTVRFRSGGTIDPDGDALSYEWSFGDGGRSTAPEVGHTYQTMGTYYAWLSVRDARGGRSRSGTIRIVAGNQVPRAEILWPGDGAIVRPGDQVRFTGRGWDPEDGQIGARFLYWSAELHHNEHTHPFFDEIRGAKGEFTVPIGDHGSGTLFYRLQLRALDSANLNGYATVDLPLQP